MSHKELNEALETVHLELTQSDSLDPQDVEKLRQTMVQIQSALQKAETSPAQESTEEEGLSDHITQSAKSFEESHPRLTETLGRIADMLQQMGI